MQIGRLRLIATYQPLGSKGPEEIEKFKKDLENELARTPKESVPILGGDWDAQVGRGSQRQSQMKLEKVYWIGAKNTSYNMSTPTSQYAPEEHGSTRCTDVGMSSTVS